MCCHSGARGKGEPNASDLVIKKLPPPTPDGREGRMFPPEQAHSCTRRTQLDLVLYVECAKCRFYRIAKSNDSFAYIRAKQRDPKPAADRQIGTMLRRWALGMCYVIRFYSFCRPHRIDRMEHSHELCVRLRRSRNQAHAGFVDRQKSDPKSGTLLTNPARFAAHGAV